MNITLMEFLVFYHSLAIFLKHIVAQATLEDQIPAGNS